MAPKPHLTRSVSVTYLTFELSAKMSIKPLFSSPIEPTLWAVVLRPYAASIAHGVGAYPKTYSTTFVQDFKGPDP